jgi:hypothetical protein
MFYGYPATISSGYYNKMPTYSKFSAPYGKFGKPFGKYPFGKTGKSPFGKTGKSPYSKSGGFSNVVPATSVVTSPYPI